MASIAFIGDCHIGFRHRFKAQRLLDYVSAFEEAVDSALKLKPDAIVFLGDLVHHSRPDPVSLRTALRKLMEAARQCHVIVCVGNHEIEGHLGTTYSPIYGDVNERIRVLTSENPKATLTFDGKTYGFLGFEFMRSRERAQETLKSLKGDADVNILCLHQAIERYLSPYEISLSSLREAAGGYDLIVCGHVHKHQRIEEVFDVTPAYYCGSTERVSFNEWENPTGFMLFEKDDFAHPKYISVKSAAMSYVREKLKGTPDAINRRIEEIIKADKAPLLKIELEAEIEGDEMDLRRDWSGYESARTILEVNVNSAREEAKIRLERLEINEGLIREYFQKTTPQNREVEEAALDLYRRYGT
jgi:DNA repair exonuclease SbcCD nuclease subunit